MLKNMSFLALAGSLAFLSTTGCIVTTDDGTSTATSVGDGDGDTSTSGDGDGAPGDGDGDGDGAPGDGDGDGAPGDGDGDGDGAPAGVCGWVEDPNFPGYYCDGVGEDPSGMAPIACPDGMVEGDSCDISGLTGAGCCDLDGNNWYCGDDMMGGQAVVFDPC